MQKNGFIKVSKWKTKFVSVMNGRGAIELCCENNPVSKQRFAKNVENNSFLASESVLTE